MNRTNPIVHRPIVTAGSLPISKQKSIEDKDRAIREGQQNSFASLLQKELTNEKGIKFSKHAEQRLETRNIQLSNNQMQEINRAVERAEQKGIKDSLILMEDMAFIVNVPSKIVITAIDGQAMKDNIFTNIDGAVII